MAEDDGARKLGLIAFKKKDAGPVARPRLELNDDSETPAPAAASVQSKAPPPRSIFESKMSREEQATIAKALEQDASIYDYDSVYETEKQKQKQSEPSQVSNEQQQPERKPKYIYGLFKSAAMRKLESERREERKIQKELENEQNNGEKTECFVTESYRRKLEEIRALEETERRNEAADSEAARYDPLAINRLLFAHRTGEKLPSTSNQPTGDEAESTVHVQIQKKILNIGNRQFRKRESREADSGSESESNDGSEADAASGSNANQRSSSGSESDNEARAAGKVAERVTSAEPTQPSEHLRSKKKESEPVTEDAAIKQEDSIATKKLPGSGSAIETLKKQLETTEQRFDRWKAKCAKRSTEESIRIERQRYFERRSIREATRDYIEPEVAAT